MQISCNSEKIATRILLSYINIQEKIPHDVIEKVEKKCNIWVLGLEGGTVITNQNKGIICLNWFSIDKIMHCNDEELQFIIAHEIAHFVLGNTEFEHTKNSKNELRKKEKEANDLLKSWGFSRPERWKRYYSK
jgi:Zn-dependent peptidase ImmA (M78 family)